MNPSRLLKTPVDPYKSLTRRFRRVPSKKSQGFLSGFCVCSERGVEEGASMPCLKSIQKSFVRVDAIYKECCRDFNGFGV